ncbi:hypothetical protein J6590_030396 [Homalodisca vitripennis]|nr:hypothetical protein J6590_030396 [Homalodisca vitripennis]
MCGRGHANLGLLLANPVQLIVLKIATFVRDGVGRPGGKTQGSVPTPVAPDQWKGPVIDTFWGWRNLRGDSLPCSTRQTLSHSPREKLNNGPSYPSCRLLTEYCFAVFLIFARKPRNIDREPQHIYCSPIINFSEVKRKKSRHTAPQTRASGWTKATKVFEEVAGHPVKKDTYNGDISCRVCPSPTSRSPLTVHSAASRRFSHSHSPTLSSPSTSLGPEGGAATPEALARSSAFSQCLAVLESLHP